MYIYFNESIIISVQLLSHFKVSLYDLLKIVSFVINYKLKQK